MDEIEKEKSVKFDSKSIQKQQPPQNSQFNLPLRTQSFNQNHPAFPLNPNNQPDYLSTLRNVPNITMDKGTNFQFNKSELPNMNNPIMMPFGAVQQPNMNVNMKVNKMHSGFSQQPNSYGNQQMPPGPYPPGPFPPSFNMMNREEVPAANNSWWPSNPPPPPANNNFPSRYENFPVNNYPYQGNMGPYMPPTSIIPKPDFSKPPPSGPTQGAGDIFNPSIWSSFHRPHYSNDSPGAGYDGGGGQSISMRQAMLKEANMPGVSNSPVGRFPNTSVSLFYRFIGTQQSFVFSATTSG